MSRVLYNDRLGTVIKHATPLGAIRESSTRWSWDLAGNCETPKQVELHSRPSGDHRRSLRKVVIKPGKAHALTLTLDVRCRRCRTCREARQKMWIARAMHEVRNARRTWFATFTLAPEHHYEMQCRAVAIASARSVPTKELTGEELLNLQSNEVAKEMTLFLKRLRKSLTAPNRISRSCESTARTLPAAPEVEPSASLVSHTPAVRQVVGNAVPAAAEGKPTASGLVRGPLRYILVREKHKSGLPHYHALLHESGGVPITHKVLTTNWKLGHSKFKLVEESERAAFYVVKYLGKADEGRVRCSLRYGRASGRDTSSDIASAQRSVWSDYLEHCEAVARGSAKNSQKTGRLQTDLSVQETAEITSHEFGLPEVDFEL